MTDLRAYLRSLDAETLADLLHDQATRDPELQTRLQLRAGEAGGDLAEVSSLLDRAVPGRESFAEAAKIGAVLDTLQRLLDAGTQADVAPLARRAVDRITKALQHMDDSSGAVGRELQRAVGLYARACAAHPPKPEQLADWILGVEFDGPGRPDIELADFAKALGENGLQRIKSTVDKVLAEAEPGKPGRLPAERLNEQLAEISGDVDALLVILSKRLPRLDVSLKIVRVLRAAGRTTEAVAHAAQALAQDKGPAQAPVAETVQEPGQRDADELVRILVAEERLADAIVVYKLYIDQLIEQKDAARYREAAKRLRKLRTLCRTAGTPEEFGSYLTDLVRTHKRKARLLAEIRNARIALPKG